ncbi:hypothetical protein B0H19DRAFT_1333164 [Mycena capillaripes]|nr:hypothetical protein B0H19DRAFT_1333164 [Mycena capillaripes]
MRISFFILFVIVLSLDAFAAPVPNANVGDEFALEVRKAKVAAKKAPVKAKAPAIKAKPPPKTVAPKPVKPAAAPKPVAKKPAVAPKPVAVRSKLSSSSRSIILTNYQKKPAVAPKPVVWVSLIHTIYQKKPAVAPKPVAVNSIFFLILVSLMQMIYQKKPVAKPAVAPKPVAWVSLIHTIYQKKPAVAPKPVAKPVAKPAVAPKPVVKKPVTKPAVAPKPVAVTSMFFLLIWVSLIRTISQKKPVTKPAVAPKPVAVKPAAKTAAAPKPVAKKPVTAPAKKPETPAKAAPQPSAQPAKAAPAAKVPASCALRKKPAGKARADAEDLTARASTPITACGVNIRASNALTLCKSQEVTFTFVNDKLVKNQLTRRAKKDDDKDFVPDDEPAGSPECDHVLELQVLKKTLESPGGVCDTMDAMIASPNSGLTAADKEEFMADIKAAINGKTNLFFLDDKLNQVKRDEVTASLKGQAPKASLQSDLSKQRIAVNDYLTNTSVNGPSTKLATKLDTLIAAMLTKVETDALANIASCAGTTKTADADALKAAKAKLKTPPTITSAWNNVLSHVAAQAKI